VRYSTGNLAERDLDDVYSWGWEEFGEAAADRYFSDLVAVFDLIADNPRLGRPIEGGYRVHNHRSQVIVYRILPGDRVDIVRVLHARQDWRQHIS
jgi:toxin ParE1/3/4